MSAALMGQGARRWRLGVSTIVVLALSCPSALVAQGVVASPDAAPAPAVSTSITTTTVTTTAVVPPSPDAMSRPWTLAALPDDAVSFHGIVNTDKAGLGSGAMLYPTTAALGVLGVLVGIATHAAIVAGSRHSQESKAQEAADQVVAPYHDALAAFHLRDLEQRALSLTPSGAAAHLRTSDETPAGELLVQAVPAFAMTPDSAALVLDEAVIVREMGAAPDPDKPPQAIRVVSAPRLEADPAGAWGADNGAALKQTAAAMMAESLDIALAQARRPPEAAPPYRTVRYTLGDAERMERAQLLGETCDHLLIRNLRGDLMAVPHRPGATLPAGCPAAPVPAARAVASPASGAASGVVALAAAPAPSAPTPLPSGSPAP